MHFSHLSHNNMNLIKIKVEIVILIQIYFFSSGKKDEIANDNNRMHTTIRGTKDEGTVSEFLKNCSKKFATHDCLDYGIIFFKCV